MKSDGFLVSKEIWILDFHPLLYWGRVLLLHHHDHVHSWIPYDIVTHLS